MCREIRLLAAIFSFAVVCTESLAAESTSAGGASNPAGLVVRLVDVDGKPIEGARVSTFAEFADFPIKSKYFAPDESGWNYFSKVVSDRDGRARVTDGSEIDLVVARHVGKKLVAIQSINPKQAKEPVTVTMYPQCKVFGRLTSKALEARHRKFTWSNVYLYLNKEQKRPMSCQSRKGEFHFYVPPGTYKLVSYSTETHAAFKTITVKPGQETLEVDPMDMRPTQLTLLEGQPAPELQDIVAWKNGGPVKLADLRGKVVILEFWGHWCGPCVGRMLLLFATYDKYRDKGLVVIGIHVDAGFAVNTVPKLDAKLVDVKKRLWKDRDLPFPVALVLETRTPNGSDGKLTVKCPLVFDVYGITGFPTAVLIDRQGRVVGEFYPDDEISEATLQKKLSEK